MSAPQLEDGYTRIANELLDALARIRVPGEARQVLDVIFRKTYGFNKLADQIATSQFVEATGLIRQNVTRAVRTLEELNLVIVTSNGASSPATFRINKNYSTWRPESKKIRGTRIKIDSPDESKKIHPESNLMPPDESKKIRERIKKDSEPNQKRFEGESNLMPTKDIERKKDKKDIATTTAAVTVRELSLLFNRYAGANIVGGGQIVVLQDFARDFTREAITEAFQAAASANVEARRFLSWCKTRMERRQVAEQEQQEQKNEKAQSSQKLAEVQVGTHWKGNKSGRVYRVTATIGTLAELEDEFGEYVPPIEKSILLDSALFEKWDGGE